MGPNPTNAKLKRVYISGVMLQSAYGNQSEKFGLIAIQSAMSTQIVILVPRTWGSKEDISHAFQWTIIRWLAMVLVIISGNKFVTIRKSNFLTHILLSMGIGTHFTKGDPNPNLSNLKMCVAFRCKMMMRSDHDITHVTTTQRWCRV